MNETQLALFDNTTIGWQAPTDLDADQWREFGRNIGKADAALNWIVGDWLLAHRGDEWGGMHRLYEEAAELTGWGYDKLKACKITSATFDLDKRLSKLPWSTHLEIARRASDNALDYLKRAEADGLSVRGTIAMIEADKAPATGSNGHNETDVAGCGVCNNLYDGSTFKNCPYCYKERHGLRPGFIDGFVDMVNNDIDLTGNSRYRPQKEERITPEPPPNFDTRPAQQIEQKTERRVNYITLEDWEVGVRGLGEQVTSSMNRVNENIEWAAFSWNPVTGCKHNCAYCYARDIANRFYPQKFEPAFLPERLGQPDNTKPIHPRWEGDTGHRNVFTCSMADLFGKWVPTEWIEAVLETIRNNPQWNFLLLTKFPIRMAEFDYPPNVWLGTSVDYQWAVERAEKAFRKIKASGFEGVCWLSCEPMMERLTFSSLDMFDWVVMGGSSKSTKTPEYKPPFEDIIHLHNQARASGCLVYQKTNLIERLREYPA